MTDTIPSKTDALRKSMEDAANVAGPLWLSFVFVLFYVLLAIASVTHKNMFLQSPVKLPFPDVELPLLAFFWVGPVIVLLVHAYVLQHLAMLATRVRQLDVALDTVPHPDPTGALLPVNIFVQMVADPPDASQAGSRNLMRLVAWSTVVIGPVLTLLFFELQFLPFHSEPTTWWARSFVLLDLALLWFFWPRASLQSPTMPAWLGWSGTGRRLVFMSGFSLATIYIAILVATFPGEWVDRTFAMVPLHETLISGAQNGDQRVHTLFPNRLFLAGTDLIDHKVYDTQAKLATMLPEYSMRGRHLEHAILNEAQLGRMNFIDAHLDGAAMLRIRAQGAWFNNANLEGAQLDGAELQGASFYGAHMAGATMEDTQLEGASIAGADLQAAWLVNAVLDGASLAGADLRRATLDDASLIGVSLKGAHLQAASLAGAKLEAARLAGAEIWKTDFSRVDGGSGVDVDEVQRSQMPLCAGLWNDNCGILPTVEDIIEHVPDTAHRAGMLKRLTKPFLAEQKEYWEDTSNRDFNHLKKMDAVARANSWRQVACAGKGAPYVIAMLVDTYKDASGWTRPTAELDRNKLIDALLKPTCPALAAVSADLRMLLLDLGGPALDPPGPVAQAPALKPRPDKIIALTR